MSKTIGIIELYQHNEVLVHYCKLLLLSDRQIYVFCNEKVFLQLPKDIRSSRINWILNHNEADLSRFLQEQSETIAGCDQCLITSVFSNFKAFNHLSSLTKCIFIIHSAYTWFEPLKHIHLRASNKLSDFLRLIKFILTGQRKWRRAILESCYKIAIPNQRIYDHVKQIASPKLKQKLMVLPFGAYEGDRIINNKKDHIHLVIPGTLSPEVRDYHVVLHAFKSLKGKQKTHIKLSLLGNAASSFGKQIVKQFDAIQDNKFTIEHWSGFIDQNLYDRVISESDYLLLPLKEFTQFYVFKEKTCLSKLSGSVNDMIRHGKTTIASQYLKVDDIIDQNIIRFFSADDLANVLIDLPKPTNLNNSNFKHYDLSTLLIDLKHQIDL